MQRIDDSEEFGRDWDWFAVDEAGYIGHFTTAGLRALPDSVRRDRDAAESLIRHFEEAPPSCTWELRVGAERDSGGWGAGGQDRFVRSFAEMSTKGLFSYNTQTVHGPEAAYYLVTRPGVPLHIDSVPADVKQLLARTRSRLRFDHSDYVSEAETLKW